MWVTKRLGEFWEMLVDMSVFVSESMKNCMGFVYIERYKPPLTPEQWRNRNWGLGYKPPPPRKMPSVPTPPPPPGRARWKDILVIHHDVSPAPSIEIECSYCFQYVVPGKCPNCGAKNRFFEEGGVSSILTNISPDHWAEALRGQA
jgi:hypothetical protein